MGNVSKAFEKAGYKVPESRPSSPQPTPPRVQSAPSGSAPPPPGDYVDRAEKVMRSLGRPDNRDPSRLQFGITTSKIRNILSLVSDIYNTESVRKDEKLSGESVAKLMSMRVRILYEAGRDERAVRPFVERSGILEDIKRIGDNRKRFIDFARYMEALVAYHRYLGGKD